MPSKLEIATLVRENFDLGVRFPSGLFFPEHWESEFFEEELKKSASTNDLREFIERNDRCLPALTSDGFCRLMGHFLLYAIEFPESNLAERLIFHLDGTQHNSYWLDRVHKLTRKQIAAIKSFLEWFSSLKEIEFVSNHAAEAIKAWQEFSEIR